MGREVSSIGLSGSGSGTSSSGMAGVGSSSSIGLSDSGLTYNSIEECSHLCPWLQRRGERARCSREGGLGGLCGGLGCLGGVGDWVGDKSCLTGGWDNCGKADGKMTAWCLVSGAGVIDGAGPDNKGSNEDKGE